MAGSRIKGITIEIGGDTTNLQKSLKSVDSALKTTQDNLKDINKLLKMDPTNVNLLKQKQENLSNAITDTKDRLKVLKDAYKELGKEGTPEAQEQQKALAREISETESKLKSLKAEMKDFGSVAKQELQYAGEAVKDVGDKMQNAGKGLTAKLTAPILAVGSIGVTYNAQMEQLQVLFTTLTGSAEEADRVIKNIQADASRSPFDTETLIKANQYLMSAGIEADDARQTILNLGNAIAATGGGSAELERMAANLQQIKNVGKASSQDIKQFANAGINIYGLLADAMGVSVEKVKDMDVSYEVLADALAKASEEGGKYFGAMESQSDTMTGSISKLKDSIKVLLGEITKAAMPVIKKVIAAIQKVVDWFSALDDSQKETILKIAAVVAAIGPALIIAGKVVSVIGTIISALGMLTSPIGLVVAGVAAAVAIFVKLSNSMKETGGIMQTIKDKISKLWDSFRNLDFITLFGEKWKWLGSILNTVKDAFIGIVDWLGKAINKVSDFLGLSSDIATSTAGRVLLGGGSVGGGTNVWQSGGIGINMNIHIDNNGTPINETEVNRWADMLADRLDLALGRRF